LTVKCSEIRHCAKPQNFVANTEKPTHKEESSRPQQQEPTFRPGTHMTFRQRKEYKENMNKYTANYSHSNHNFVIQNLRGQRIENEYLPAICILKNILQRGRPTLPSKFLQENIGAIHKTYEFQKPYPLIDNKSPTWERIIRGDIKGNYFPAKKFYEELIPKHLSNYLFIQQLLIPEVPVNEITQVEVDEFANQQVDYYLPQAFLIIEIDGSQHDRNVNQDKLRDQHTAKYGIKTIRIKTTDLETENESFKKAITAIKERIDKVISRQEKRRQNDSVFISINDYKSAFENGADLTSPFYKATAIIRFQILVLELLERGLLDFNKEWKFELHTADINDFADLAIQDLMQWFEPIFGLHKIKWNRPKYSIKPVSSIQEFSNSSDTIKVDFSLLKRYTDEFQTNPDVLFERTDYLDEYLYFKKGDSRGNLKFISFEPYDYFKVSTNKPVRYKLQFGGKKSDENSLLFLLQNIFLQDVLNLTFNEGQLPIIANVLSRNDTIGLLPTGSGKSVCYQLAAILQPAISFVVCPIKSLMYDQKADLDLCRFTRVNHITSDDDGEDKEKIQNEFGNGKYLFIFISPERFQIKTFRQYFSAVNKKFNIAYAVIDEVHCLSEWGHDFRTAYLNLSNTIQKLCSDFNFIGLTATASINVLKDIQVEFGIKQDNVKTPVDYTRKELAFEVVDDGNDKIGAIKQLLGEFHESEEILATNGNDSRCGIIFTPTVNGTKGCYPLSLVLSEHFQTEIKYYSGYVPKTDGRPIMGDKEYDEYKKQVQQDYRENEFTLLTATKAFGMGINKPNIHFTVHYGIPGSMEALYQEGGRAGRDKAKFNEQQAKCIVLLSKSTNPKQLIDQFWIRETQLSKLNELRSKIDGDLNTNFFLFSLGLDIIKDEFETIKKLHERYSVSNEKNVRVEGKEIGVNKAKAEKAIYRLSQLRIIEDWTIKNFFGGGEFEVDYSEFDSTSIKYSLLKTINKYDPDFSFDSINSEAKYSTYRRILNAPEGYSNFDKYILILLQWSYDNFAYNRRQSLKNIYESCCEFSEGNITKKEFKARLENYFKFNQSSYVLQHIAENPKDIERWFEVFYQVDKNIITDKLLTGRLIEALRDNLSRFLESYMYNPGLDLISGLLRLWLDDYENIDGRNRLESSLEEIQHFEESQIDFISTQILRIGKELTNRNKNFLAESLYRFFNKESFLHRIHIELGDTFSLARIIEPKVDKIQKIKNRVYERLSEVR
jgi:ATP-dependent DNA helicase RecQ